MKIKINQNGWVEITAPTDTPLERFEILFFRQFGFFPDIDELQHQFRSEGELRILSVWAFPVAV